MTLKALAQWPADQPRPLLVGCRRWLDDAFHQLQTCSTVPLADPAGFEVLDLPLEKPLAPGQAGAASGAASFHWLSAAVEHSATGPFPSMQR